MDYLLKEILENTPPPPKTVDDFKKEIRKQTNSVNLWKKQEEKLREVIERGDKNADLKKITEAFRQLISEARD